MCPLHTIMLGFILASAHCNWGLGDGGQANILECNARRLLFHWYVVIAYFVAHERWNAAMCDGNMCGGCTLSHSNHGNLIYACNMGTVGLHYLVGSGDVVIFCNPCCLVASKLEI